MKFLVPKDKYNILNLTRKIGYSPHRNQKSYYKRLGREDFPRFHIYIKEQSSAWEFSLHLDQKRPSYQGHTAHSGDYQGEVLEEEKKRIINLLKI